MIDPDAWVLDFGDLKKAVRPIIDLLDHHMLNDIPGLGNPTAELGLTKTALKETQTSGVIDKHI